MSFLPYLWSQKTNFARAPRIIFSLVVLEQTLPLPNLVKKLWGYLSCKASVARKFVNFVKNAFFEIMHFLHIYSYNFLYDQLNWNIYPLDTRFDTQLHPEATLKGCIRVVFCKNRYCQKIWLFKSIFPIGAFTTGSRGGGVRVHDSFSFSCYICKDLQKKFG